MKYIFFFIGFIVSVSVKSQKTEILTSFGIDYRTYPIDIEDAQQGPLPTSTYGELTGSAFWKVLSVHGKLGVKTKDNWLFSLSLYSRYNHNHFLDDPYIPNSPNSYYYNEDTRAKNKIKFDVFVETEKKIRIKRNHEQYFTMLLGVGYTNLNSNTDITYLKNNVSGGTAQPTIYKGSFQQFCPKLSIGYQYKKIKGSIDSYFIEDPLLTNYTSIWLGATISYELVLKKRSKI
jgi:hypothetical protein